MQRVARRLNYKFASELGLSGSDEGADSIQRTKRSLQKLEVNIYTETMDLHIAARSFSDALLRLPAEGIKRTS